MARALFAVLLLLSQVACAQVKIGDTTLGNTQIGYIAPLPPTPPDRDAQTPQMGWSSWPGLSCPACYNGGPFVPPTESTVKAQADKLANPALPGLCAAEYVPNGGRCVSLTALGYNLVAIDAGWDECVSGSPPCLWQPIAAQFPDGISGTAAYIHAKGQLVSLYGSPGPTDCVNYPALYQHETADIALMASWGVDELRSDWCPSAGPVYGSADQLAFQIERDAIVASGRTMGFDVNDAGTSTPSWFQTVGGTRVRIGIDNPGGRWYEKFTTGDLSYATPYQTKGHWLDFDVLMGGQAESSQTQTVTDAEARAQFNMHAITASPLIIGSTIESLNSYNLQTYANSEVIAINQDALGQMGTMVATTSCCQVWSRLLANGDYAIALVNYDSNASHSASVNWSDFGQSGTFQIRDLWTHASAGSSSSGYTTTLGAWGSAMLRLSR
jgi:alpha-galactosidase